MVCALVAVALSPHVGNAADLRFTHVNPAGIAGYRVYAGPQSRSYLWSYDLGARSGSPGAVLVLPFPIDPPSGLALFVALTAYDASGRESAFSNEIVLAAPGTRGLDDGVADDGSGSGVVGDRPCSNRQTLGCDDNCPLVPNGPGGGTCIDGSAGRVGRPCFADADCAPAGSCSRLQDDRDGDGVGDACDRCRDVANRSQLDVDQDGFGNACDADFDGDGLVRVDDLNLFYGPYGTTSSDPRYDARFDAEGDQDIDLVDWQTASAQLDGPPGPSALLCPDGEACRLAATCPISSGDADLDGVGDACDSCRAWPNPTQLDSDLDGFGNACDYDYNGDRVVDQTDAAFLQVTMGARAGGALYWPQYDGDGNGVIDLGDWNRLWSLIGLPPGPSGLACAGTYPCLRP